MPGTRRRRGERRIGENQAWASRHLNPQTACSSIRSWPIWLRTRRSTSNSPAAGACTSNAVYRWFAFTGAQSKDAGTEQLLAAEPAYIIVPKAPRPALHALKLMRAVVEHLAQHFGNCLVIEVWSSPSANLSGPPSTHNGDARTSVPPFEILAPATRIPRKSVEALSKSLGRDILPHGGTRIELIPFEKLASPGTKPVLRVRDCVAWNCFVLGIAARPEYRGKKGKSCPMCCD